MIPPPKRRWCRGYDTTKGVHVRCPTDAELPINDWRRKRCPHCAPMQRVAMKAASFRRHWPQYREQRRHPKRTALFHLAAEAGLVDRAA